MEVQSSVNSSKSSKLRKACTQCAGAKLRCSGEQSGCTRCQANHQECIYKESRVGKVPGRRARKGKLAIPGLAGMQVTTLEGEQIQTRLPAYDSSKPPTAVNLGFDDGAKQGDHARGDLYVWTNVSAHAAPVTQAPSMRHEPVGYLNDSFMLGVPEMQDTPQDFSISSWDGSIDNIDSQDAELDSATSESIAGVDVSTTSSTLPPLSKGSDIDSSLRRDLEVESNCVSACCHIIGTLEMYIEQNLRAFDIFHETLQKALETLAQLLGFRDQWPARCYYLFLAILEQVVQLLEGVIANLLAETKKTRAENGAGRASDAMSYQKIDTSVGKIGNLVLAFDFSRNQASDADRRALKARDVARKLVQVQSLLDQIASPRTHGRDGMFNGCTLQLRNRIKILERDVGELKRG